MITLSRQNNIFWKTITLPQMSSISFGNSIFDRLHPLATAYTLFLGYLSLFHLFLLISVLEEKRLSLSSVSCRPGHHATKVVATMFRDAVRNSLTSSLVLILTSLLANDGLVGGVRDTPETLWEFGNLVYYSSVTRYPDFTPICLPRLNPILQLLHSLL